MVVLNVLDFINVRKESSVQFFSCAVLCYNTYYFEHVQNVFRCSVVQMVLLARSHIIVNAVNSFQVTDNILAIHSSAFFFYSNFYSPKDLTPHPETSHHTQRPHTTPKQTGPCFTRCYFCVPKLFSSDFLEQSSAQRYYRCLFSRVGARERSPQFPIPVTQILANACKHPVY